MTADQMNAANESWGANCGPGALAEIMKMTLDEVRPHLPGFEAKRYTNPTMMFGALKSIGRPWRRGGNIFPSYGLARIQWEGPWTAPGVPIAARYRHTHWVGVYTGKATLGIFDINALGNGTGWCSLDDWSRILVPWILKECVPRADGGWHVTHGIEIEHPSDREGAR